MAVQLSQHPSPETLVSFARGTLAEEATVEIDAHLAACSTCRQTVATVEPDSFEARLKESRRSDVTPEPPHRLDPSGWSQGSGTAYQAAPNPLPPELLSGAVELVGLPDYELIRKLGQGGMGAVYLARNTLANQRYALKVISPAFLANPGAEGRFRQEIQAAIALGHHPNIVTAATAFRHGGALILAMEYVEGQSVDEELKNRTELLPIAYACSYVAQAALGLAHAHEKGMVHRDVKPSNLMLTRVNGKHVVKVLDFGLAKPGGSDATGLTETGWAMGTPDFVAPEQARDARRADARSDIYSLGCTLYYLLAKQPPFPGGTAVEKIMRHVGEEPASISSMRSDVPKELSAFLSRMMAKDPTVRPSSAREVVKALSPYTKLKPTAVSPTSRPASADPGEAESETGSVLVPELPSATKAVSALPPQSRCRRAIAIGAGVTLLLLAGVIGAWAGGVFKIKTDRGTLVIENVPADAEVLVNGNQVAVTRNGSTVTLETLPVGTYGIRVKSGGTELMARDAVAITTNGVTLSAKVVPTGPPAESPPLKPAAVPDPVLGRWTTFIGPPEWPANVEFFDDGTGVVSFDPVVIAAIKLRSGEDRSLFRSMAFTWERKADDSYRVLIIGGTPIEFRVFEDRAVAAIGGKPWIRQAPSQSPSPWRKSESIVGLWDISLGVAPGKPPVTVDFAWDGTGNPADLDSRGATNTVKASPPSTDSTWKWNKRTAEHYQIQLPGNERNAEVTIARDKMILANGGTVVGTRRSRKVSETDRKVVHRGWGPWFGDYRIEGGEFIQTKVGNSKILFGSLEWADFDLSLEMMTTSGRESGHIIFRGPDSHNFYILYLKDGDGKAAIFKSIHERKTRLAPSVALNAVNNRWYHVEIRARGPYVWISVDGQPVFAFQDSTFTKGLLGLATFGSSVKWRNLKLRHPDGTLLWEGFPEL